MPQPLPSILELGQLAKAASNACDADLLEEDEKSISTLLWHREVALRNLLMTFRAQTVADAVTQLYVGYIAVDSLLGFDMPPEDRDREAATARRALLSAIPVIAAAAGFDLAEIGTEYIPEFATHEFPAEA